MIRAAIAIGSNSTRSLVMDTADRFRVLSRGREETLLMMGLDDQGYITPEAMERTVAAVRRLYDDAVALGARTVDLMATSASRDAKNSDVFAQKLQEATGLSLRIISGQEEAALAFRAVAGTENCLVIDIGGGSTEITYGEKGHILFSHSAQMGCSRLLKMQEIQSLADAENAIAIARSVIREPMQRIMQGISKAPAMTGIGGTCTTCAAMNLKREAHGDQVEGITVTMENVKNFLALLAPMTPDERKQVPGVPASRVHHFPHGLCILLAIMEESGIHRFTVSGRTNLDGHLMSL